MDLQSQLDMLDNILEEYSHDASANNAHRVASQTRIVRGLQREQITKGVGKHFGPGKYNKRRCRQDCSCSKCHDFLEKGTVCWLTVGESPRCVTCGPGEV